MIDTEALRKKVIDLAIQGKLTEQLPSDGDAETLYAQIQEEKAKLVKEGKIKKDKPSSEISEDEILFDIPSNWKWVHLNEIAVSSLGKTLNKSTDKGDLCKYLCSINVQWNEINLDTVKMAKFEDSEKEKYKLYRDDLLICEGGDSGRCAIWDSDEEMYYQNALHRVRFFCDISPRLYCYIIEYYKKSGIISFYTKGIGIQHLVQASLNALWLPLPPLSEQKRIVKKLQSVMSEIDIIDYLQAKYSNDLAVLKSKIIDAGIQGKLTEQLPEDGDAEDLYAQIQNQKSQLIKDGKIKKEKPLPDITADEIPFEIPKNWKWVRLSRISNKITDGTHHSPVNTPSGDYMYITAKNIKPDGISLDDITYVSSDIHDEIYARCNPEKEDILLIKDGATTGVVTVNNLDYPFSLLSSVALIKCSEYVEPWYLVYAMRSSWFSKHIKKEMTGVGITRVVLRQIESFVMPLPPHNEQKRIVAKIEAIMEQLN